MNCFKSLLLLPLILAVGGVLYPVYRLFKAFGWVKPVIDTTHAARRDFVAVPPDCPICHTFIDTALPSEHLADEFDARLRTHFVHVEEIPAETTAPEFTFGLWQFGGHSFRGADIHRCVKCGQLWELSRPDHAWRGYFRAIRFQLPPNGESRA